MNKILWSKEDVLKLAELKYAGNSAGQIAKILNRSVDSIYNKIKREGLATPKPESWSSTDDKQLLYFRTQGLTSVEIGRKLGRTKHSVEMRVARLRKIDNSIEKLNCVRSQKWTREELLSWVRDNPNNYCYAYKSATNLSMPSLKLIYKTFGSWSNATREAGLDVSKTGLSRSKSTLLYLVYYNKEDFYKIGITQQSSVEARLRSNPGFKLIDFITFENVEDAEYYEDKVLFLMQSNAYVPSFLSSGKTECFKSLENITSIEEVLCLM